MQPREDEMALNGALSYQVSGRSDYSDPHSPDEQRFFDIICLLHGDSPDKYEYLIENGRSPRQRAFDCEED